MLQTSIWVTQIYEERKFYFIKAVIYFVAVPYFCVTACTLYNLVTLTFKVITQTGLIHV